MDKLYVVVHNSFPSETMMEEDLRLLQKSQELSAPILRLYSWERPTISLGRLQKAEVVLDVDKVERSGICIVKRPTGGRAVYHAGDFTYSILMPHGMGDLFGTTVSETYQIISKALVAALSHIKVDVDISKSNVSREKMRSDAKLSCFLSPTPNEIVVQGKKLIGSAQYRGIEGVLQHGSLPVTDEFYRMPFFEKCSSEEQTKREQHLRRGAVSLCEVVSVVPTFDVLAEAFTVSFSNQFALEPVLLRQ